MAPSGAATVALEWSFLSLSYLFVSLRIKAFFRRRTSTWIPEIFLVFGLILETGVCICDTITNHLGGMVGDNINDVPMTLPLNKLSFVSDVLFFLGIFLPKACLLAFYYNLVPITANRVRIALKCIIVYVAVCALIVFLGQFATCRPLSTSWSVGSDYCAFPAGGTFFEIHSSLDISCDIMIFVLPFFLIHSLHLPRRQKYGVYGIFLLGAVTIAIAISRFISVNISQAVTPLYLWAAAEYCVSMIVVCLPSLKILIKGLGDSAPSTTGKNSWRRSRMYDSFPTSERTNKDGVTTIAEAVSEHGSQVELRQLENTILKTSTISMA